MCLQVMVKGVHNSHPILITLTNFSAGKKRAWTAPVEHNTASTGREPESKRHRQDIPRAISSGDQSPTTSPITYNPSNFYDEVLQAHVAKTPSQRVVVSDDGERLLAAGAAWDMITNHDLFKRGLVDIGEISDRLKNRAKCDGQGPVFLEDDVLEAIVHSVNSEDCELILR